jgi:O-antigen/teichoic acid export membrane protein
MTPIGHKYSMLKNLFRATAAHDGVRRYGFNMLWLLLGKVFLMAIGFTVGVYVARKLGPDNFGILNYAISFAAIFSILVNLGLDQILICELVKRPRRRNTASKHIFF